MRGGIPAAVLGCALWLACFDNAAAEVVIKISKSQQQVAVSVDGTPRYRWRTSTGRKGYGTPVGTYRPQRLERDWYSRKYGRAPMPHSIFFHKGYAIHGTTETARLGSVASHGCVRLAPENAAALFALVERQGKKDTRIVVSEASLPAPEPVARPLPRTAPRPSVAPEDSLSW